jgi:hypothetical protein
LSSLADKRYLPPGCQDSPAIQKILIFKERIEHPRFPPRIPDLDFSIPDPVSGFFHPGSRIRKTELAEHLSIFNLKNSY